MTLITFQNGKPVMRDGKVGTGQGCCCDGCCECACPGGFQVRVNGNVINTTACDFYGPEGWKYPHALGPYATFGHVTVSPPTDYLYGCDELFYPNGDAPGYDIYDNPDFWPDFSAYFGSAKYCLKCENNRLILSLGLYISYPWSTASYSLYDAFYEVQGTCPEALSVTLTEPIIGGELVTPDGGPTFVPRGVVRNGIIYREGDWYDANGALPTCPRPAEFDPSQLTVEIECNPAGVCRFEDPQFPPYLPCLGWAGLETGYDGALGGGPQDLSGVYNPQAACEFEGGTWHPDERCEDNPCADNPFP